MTRSAARSARSLLPVLLGGAAPDLPALDKFKYLVPSDFTVGQLIYVIRKRMCVPARAPAPRAPPLNPHAPPRRRRVPPDTAVFVYCGAQLPTSTTVISELYSSSKDIDGFLYLTFAGESAFG